MGRPKLYSDKEQAEKAKVYARLYREKNPNRVKNWIAKNKERHADTVKNWYIKNKKKIVRCVSVWQKNNPDKVRGYQRRYQSGRLSTDPSYRIARNIRIRINKAIRRRGQRKTDSVTKWLGCSLPELVSYIESKFCNGMTWNNYGEWHIDHIIPLASFDLTDTIQFQKACHFTNLQPMWATENIKKSNKFYRKVHS